MTTHVTALPTAPASVFDLEKIDTPAASEAGYEFELLFNGAKTGWFVTVRGEHSPTVKRWHLGVGNKFRLKEWREKRKGKGDNPEPMTEEDLELGLRGAVARLAGFRGIVFGGQPFVFSEANAYELVRRHPPFADQILEESSEITNFSPKQ